MSIKDNLLELKNKLLKINNKKEDDYIYPNAYDELNAVLNEAIKDFFPESGFWSAACFKEHNDCLQSHLRDDYFLAKRIQKKAKLPDIYFGKILSFIRTSEQFKRGRHEYEQRIIKWQINYMLNDGEGWICDPELGGDLSLIMPECDIAFRNGVIDTLLSIGINAEAIEEGLEKNANLWRDKFIERAFNIRFNPFPEYAITKPIEPIPDASIEHKAAWVKMRKYEYYVDNQESVLKYGSLEPDMLLSDAEVVELKCFLDVENAKRYKLIEQFKPQNAHRRVLKPED